jgi:high-affinity K+ transport system ATPase subunit B
VAGDVDTLLLDKTRTITFGNRQASEFLPLPGVSPASLADTVHLASLVDEMPSSRRSCSASPAREARRWWSRRTAGRSA